MPVQQGCEKGYLQKSQKVPYCMNEESEGGNQQGIVKRNSLKVNRFESTQIKKVSNRNKLFHWAAKSI